MNKLLALCYFVLSLFGCDVDQRSFVHHIEADGAGALRSEVVEQGGVALFECERSASGQCHYTVFARDCATPVAGGAARPSATPAAARATPCQPRPIEHFVVAGGTRRVVPGLHDFSVCVSADARAVGPDCQAAPPLTSN